MHNPEVDQVPAALERRTFLTQLCASGLLCLVQSRGDDLFTDRRTAAVRRDTRFVAQVRRRLKDDLRAGLRLRVRRKISSVLMRWPTRLAARSSCRCCRRSRPGWRPTWWRNAPPPPKNTLAALVPPTDYFWTHVLTSDCIEKTEKAIEYRVTECLWAKTFRAAHASDIGYAIICHPDFATAPAFNPKSG